MVGETKTRRPATGKSIGYEQAVGGAVRGPAEVWEKLVPRLRTRLCDEWSWCERRQDARLEEPLALATLIVEIIQPAIPDWSVPAGLIAVILVKKGLDVFCGC